MNRKGLSPKYFAAVILLITAVVFTASALISMSYEKAIVRYLKTYLDEHLLTQLSMDENIRFRFLKGFPNTTIEVKNVLLLSGADFSKKDFPGSFSDTLLHARSAYLRFNPFKMVLKKYELKKIEISHGTINILFDNQNNHNLKIWKQNSGGSEGYTVNLKNVVISDTRFLVRSLSNNINFNGRSVRSNFKGSLNGKVLSGNTKGHFRIREFYVKDRVIAKNSNLQLDLNMIFSGNRFRVTQGTVQMNKATANIKGEYKGGKNSSVNASIEVPRFGLNELMSVIPVNHLISSKYEFDGNGNLTLQINGPLNGRRLSISSVFRLKGCSARNISTRSSVTGLTFSGQISGTHAENFLLRVDTFQAVMGRGKLIGNLSVSDFNRLFLKSDINAYIDLKELAGFVGMDSFEISGFVRSSCKVKGQLKGISGDSIKRIFKTLQYGVFDFENAGVNLRNKSFHFTNITGRAILRETIQIDSLALNFNETNLVIKGTVTGLKDYMDGKGLLKPELLIDCDIIDITKYLKITNQTSVTHGKKLSILPEDIHGQALVKSKRFIAGKFEAEQVSMKISTLRDSIALESFTLGFPDGSISGRAVIKAEAHNQYSVACQANPNKINIRQLFYVFNNFAQQFILDQNLKGQLGGRMDFYARWDSALRIIPESVIAKGEIEISNGELVQFEPMLKLSKYIDVEELKHIRFKTLKNSIFINNRMVSIPEMNINSSAFNISVAGEHSFDNVFDYRLRVLLSEVLFNKARKKKKEINEFLIEENDADRTTIPLIIAGTPREFDVKFDRRKAFGLSRNRKTEEPSQSTRENFRIDWEDTHDTPPVQKKQTETESTGVVIEWEE